MSIASRVVCGAPTTSLKLTPVSDGRNKTWGERPAAIIGVRMSAARQTMSPSEMRMSLRPCGMLGSPIPMS